MQAWNSLFEIITYQNRIKIAGPAWVTIRFGLHPMTAVIIGAASERSFTLITISMSGPDDLHSSQIPSSQYTHLSTALVQSL